MELEYKWKLTADTELDRLLHWVLTSAALESRETTEMKAVYYDTQDRLFSQMHGALRIREENQSRVCCMKLQTHAQGAYTLRKEYEVSAPDVYTGLSLLPAQGAPAELCLRAAQGPVVELCRTEFIRQAYRLVIGGGDELCRAELAVDAGTAAREDRSAPLSELELEHTGGSTEVFHRFAAQLAGTFHLEAQPLSKLARAMAL